MTTNCGKAVKKFVKKSAQKSWMKIVDKCHLERVSHISSEFCRVLDSFAQPVSKCKNSNFNLLSAKFYTFYTDLTNTTKIIKEGF